MSVDCTVFHIYAKFRVFFFKREGLLLNCLKSHVCYEFSWFTMSDFVKPRIFIKFCLRNEYSAVQTLEMLQKAFLWEWWECITKKSLWAVQRLQRWPKTNSRRTAPRTCINESYVKEIKSLVLENSQMTIGDLANSVVVSYELIQSIKGFFVPLTHQILIGFEKTLNFVGKKRCVNISKTMIYKYRNASFTIRLIFMHMARK